MRKLVAISRVIFLCCASQAAIAIEISLAPQFSLCPLLALIGRGATSDLSPQSAPKRTLTASPSGRMKIGCINWFS